MYNAGITDVKKIATGRYSPGMRITVRYPIVNRIDESTSPHSTVDSFGVPL